MNHISIRTGGIFKACSKLQAASLKTATSCSQFGQKKNIYIYIRSSNYVKPLAGSGGRRWGQNTSLYVNSLTSGGADSFPARWFRFIKSLAVNGMFSPVWNQMSHGPSADFDGSISSPPQIPSPHTSPTPDSLPQGFHLLISDH